MDTEYLAQRLQCSRTDKQDCMDIVQQLLELAFFVREHSPVELDNFCQRESARYKDPFLRKAVSCLVDIGDYNLARRVLEYYILSGNYIGHQFMKNIVIAETILALHQRVDVDRIFSFVVPSLFGLDFEDHIVRMYKNYIKAHGYSLSTRARAAGLSAAVPPPGPAAPLPSPNAEAGPAT